MPIYKLSNKPNFPPVNLANEDGLLAFGGKLEPEWVIEAYTRGIFPWYNEDEPILWWSPNPRSVIFIEEIKISKSMRKILKKDLFTVTFDKCFEEVICACGDVRDETWISEKFVETYTKLYEMGIAHSVEVWNGKRLVGGLYGLSLGKMFFGESMFSIETNSSKIALIKLCEYLKEKDYYVVDCQVHNSHLESMGAREIERSEFLKILENQINKKGKYSKWDIQDKK